MKNGISHILPRRYEISKTHLRALKSGEKILFPSETTTDRYGKLPPYFLYLL